MRFAGTVLNAPDPDALAAFYQRLLGWPRLMDEPDWVALRHPEGGTALAFQRDPDLVTPVWPNAAGAPRVVVHVDFVTDDLDAAVEHALAAGASMAPTQPSEDERVLLDPVGFLFCLIERTAT